ncbi:MAG: Rieske 2Fe-2S protein [Chitinophagaceae bacterium]|nr:Rieske 2Fe-2S protein [Chitinophagaceae bacterium]MDB5223022.1 Rieske 2Fe-2S protein [Chitinophagaceae bacterium]
MTREKKYKWHKIAGTESELNFATNNLLQIEVAGKKLCIAKGKELYACAAKCPHAGGIIADGFINESDVVTCPLHRYKFSLQNGRNVSGEGYYLKTYPIQTTAEGVFIGIEETGLLSWLK